LFGVEIINGSLFITANKAVPAEFAEPVAVERFIGHAGHNRTPLVDNPLFNYTMQYGAEDARNGGGLYKQLDGRLHSPLGVPSYVVLPKFFIFSLKSFHILNG
jgi:hypothetical protein